MFKFYMIPDATRFDSHSAIYSPSNMLLLWDPRAESDAYAIADVKGKAELNKAGSLEFTILPTNNCYRYFENRKSVVLAYDDNELLFEGVVTASPSDFYKKKKVTCSGPLVYLVDSIQAPDEKNEIDIPSPSSGNKYVRVPVNWYDGGDPYQQKWYERSRENGQYVYTRSSDRTANPDKKYYYIVSGSNKYVKVPTSWYENGNPRKLEWYERSRENGEFVYTKSNDRTADSSKTYYYLLTTSGENVSGITVTKTAATSERLQEHISRILGVHNTQVNPFKWIFEGHINNDDTESHDFSSSGWRTSWDAFNSDILEEYGRYARVRSDPNGTLVLDYLDIKQMSDERPIIEYTRNMIEMTESEDNLTDIFTVLVPIGKDNLTVSDVSDHDSGGDGEVDPYIVSWGGAKRYVVVSRAAVARYGYIVKTQSFSDIDDASSLYDRAVKYIKNNYDYHTEYNVKAIDLKVLGESNHRITVGDKCRVKSTWHEVDEQDLFVLSAEYDYINPENDSFKIGVPTSDREAGNRRLSSQTSNNTSSSSANASSQASSSSHTSSILENYIHATEWGLEMSSNLKNEVESNDGKYMTRFLQTEESLNLAAQKLFGVDGDNVGDPDAGYVKVLPSEYRDETKPGSPYKNPTKEHWFEKINGQYILSTDTTCDPSVVGQKDYYIQRLWSRYSEIDVGPGGINAKVDGTYEDAIASSSWIRANESSILALTGHLWVDEEGHVHVSVGSGMQTDSEEERTTPTYIQVTTVMYSQNPSPKDKRWFERVFDASGRWLGQGKADYNTNDAYYERTTDATVDRNKYYYYKSNVRQTFRSEFGVYDEDNLRAGIVTTMINNPTYHKVPEYEVDALSNSGGSPAQQGWYVYNETTGMYDQTSDTHVARNSRTGRPDYKYYHIVNNYQANTDIWGEHVVIGRTAGYNGLDANTKIKVDKYISDHNLNGTITEIASDVVTVNALIAHYIEADTITANTSLWSDYIYAHEVDITTSTGSGYLNVDTVQAKSLDAQMLGTVYLNIDGVEFGSYDTEGGDTETGNNAEEIVMAFDTPTYSGDNVTIRYRTAGMADFDNEVAITFTKPASLGAVTWSSGNKTLTVKTVGGVNFFTGQIRMYVPTNQGEGQISNSTPYLETETTGYNQTYGLYYSHVNVNGTTSEEKIALFKTPKDRFSEGSAAGILEAKGKFGLYGPAGAITDNATEGQAASTSQVLNYGATYMVYKTYDGARYGDKVFFKTPTKGSYQTYASYNNADYTSGNIALGFNDSVTVYGQRMMDDESSWSSATPITISSPADSTVTLSIDPSSTTTLDYNSSVTVTATVIKGGDTANPITESVKIKSKKDAWNEGADTLTLEQSGSNSFGDSVTVEAKTYTRGTNPSVRQRKVTTISIPSIPEPTIGGIGTSLSEPSGVLLNDLRGWIQSAITDKRWLYFKVTCGNTTKSYKMDFR